MEDMMSRFKAFNSCEFQVCAFLEGQSSSMKKRV